MVCVYVTIEPNEPAVWLVQRTQNFNPTNPMTKSALLSALREKYGKETLTARGGSFLSWIFDQSGRLLSTADAGLTEHDGNMFINNVRQGPAALAHATRANVYTVILLGHRDAEQPR